MEHKLVVSDKFDIQQNYRRYIRLTEQGDVALESHKETKASRVWIPGVIALVLSLSSNFFLGVAAGLFGLYVYSMLNSYAKYSSVADGIENLDRWFSSKGLKFEGRVLYSTADEMLESPIDPFADDCYK